ncbi:MAG: S9 family peptidase, partial [Acidobacteria bacterium]|nr:S9 family peptidase [Acidobacteriota bacterium]
MKHTIHSYVSFILFSLFATTGYAQNTPLIDRELLFGNPEISGAQLSPDGQFIAFIKPYKETRNIWVKRATEAFSAAIPLTDDTKRPIPSFFWSRDGKFVVFVQDKGGDENYNIYAVDPRGSKAPGRDVPEARNLTDLKNTRAFIYNLPKSDHDAIYVGLNDRDPAWHDLYRVKISTGERTLVRKNTERIAEWTFDAKDQLELALRIADNGDTEVLRADADGLKKVYSCSVFESCGPVRYHKDNKRVYLLTNKGNETDLAQLLLFDVETGREEPAESDPLKRVDFGNAIFSELSG